MRHPRASLPRRLIPTLPGLVLLVLCAGVRAQMAANIEAGYGQRVSVYGLALRSPDLRTWSFGERSEIALAGLARLNYWRGEVDGANPNDLWDLNGSAVLRLTRKPGTGSVLPFIEAAFGLHFLTEDQIDERHLGLPFQFGESLGIGIRFGRLYEYEVGIRAEHVSNGNLSKDNEGLTFASAYLGYHW